MNFCCDYFKFSYFRKNQYTFNYRIVKFTSDFLVNDNINNIEKIKNIRFFITLGYEEFKLLEGHLLIKYCPHCGTSLFDFYNEKYANEIEGETFFIK